MPKKVAPGEGHALAVRAVRREGGRARPQVVVDLAAPAGVPVELFAEGPTPQWALPVPMEVDGAPAGLRRFVFELDGAPPGASYQGRPPVARPRSRAARRSRSRSVSTNSPGTLMCASAGPRR